MRPSALAFGIVAGAAVLAAPALADAVTTRIETRPFYGAVVTLEEGVRVFRPLPRHDRIIINPGGQTPLSLSYSQSTNYHHHVGGGANYYAPQYLGGSYGYPVLRHLRRGHKGGGGGKR
jgi:hypothetical protein